MSKNYKLENMLEPGSAQEISSGMIKLQKRIIHITKVGINFSC